MKKYILPFILVFLIISCNSVKSTEKALNSGDYDKAISLSINNLKRNKTKEKNQPYVTTLENAFKKVKERDEKRIVFLKKENSAEKLEMIYELYQQLKNRQESIKPLLPLKNLATGRNAEFNMRNYDNDLLNVKKDYSEYLYQKALVIYKQGEQDKYKYRTAYSDLKYLDNVNSNYKDVRNLINEAYDRGADYIAVFVKNETRQIIPRRLEEELLALDTYGLDDLWSVYDAGENNKIKYDYRLELNLVQINISPERVSKKEIVREKQVKDGYKYLLNKQGRYVKDSLGNRIKVDKILNLRCKVFKTTKFKRSSIVGVVKYIDNYSNRLLNEFSIESEFVFEHGFATYRGDKRALDTPLYNLVNARESRFPTNEQMIYDTGTDLKEKFKYIITRNRFTR